MVGTIGVAGSQARKRGHLARWWWRLGFTHLVGAMVGGGLLGVILSFVGTLLVLAVADLVGIPAKHLSRARQVPLSWKHVLPAPMSASVYGLTLGIGVLSTVY